MFIGLTRREKLKYSTISILLFRSTVNGLFWATFHGEYSDTQQTPPHRSHVVFSRFRPAPFRQQNARRRQYSYYKSHDGRGQDLTIHNLRGAKSLE